MYLKQSVSNGKKYLSYVQGYRDERGKAMQKTIKKLGYLDDLKTQYVDPIKYFKDLAKSNSSEIMNEYTLKYLNTIKITPSDTPRNLGYAPLKHIYNELGLNAIFNKVHKKSKAQYDLNEIMPFLAIMRIIKPGSKRDNYENKNLMFENYSFSLDDIYKSLTLMNPLKEKIEKAIWENTKDSYHRDTSKCYYDCTNYYFEIEYNDEDVYAYDENGELLRDEFGDPIIEEKGLRKRGPEKNKRPDPIVEMGLLMDASEIPLSYDLFPGNESEKLSLLPIVNRTKSDYDLERVIVVADRGLNTSDNIILLSGTTLEQAKKLNGYVYGQSVRGADVEFKEWVLSGNYITDVVDDGNGRKVQFIHKSRVYPKKMYVTRDDKGKTKSGNEKKETVLVDQKQMVYYSQKYADKQKRDREKVIAKAKDLISHPEKYNKATSYGIAGYVNNLAYVKSTGEIASGRDLSINQERIDEEAKYDGYYSIVTSEEHLSDIEIRNTYRGLSKIEETFKVTKSGLEDRPVWLSRKDHIESHFLTCFVALVLERLLEKRLKNKYSFYQVIGAVRSYTSAKIEHDLYMQSFINDVIEDIGQEFNIDLSRKFRTLSEIKKILN